MRKEKSSIKNWMMRQYNSFSEIDRDLRLLKVQREIEKERIILSYNLTKESLAPTTLLKNFAGTIFKSTIILKGTTKVLDLIGNRFR